MWCCSITRNIQRCNKMIYKIHYQYTNLEIICIFIKSCCSFENSNRFLNFFASKGGKKEGIYALERTPISFKDYQKTYEDRSCLKAISWGTCYSNSFKWNSNRLPESLSWRSRAGFQEFIGIIGFVSPPGVMIGKKILTPTSVSEKIARAYTKHSKSAYSRQIFDFQLSDQLYWEYTREYTMFSNC